MVRKRGAAGGCTRSPQGLPLTLISSPSSYPVSLRSKMLSSSSISASSSLSGLLSADEGGNANRDVGGVLGIPKDDTESHEVDGVDDVREGGVYDTVPVSYVLLDVYPSNNSYALVRLVRGGCRRGMGIGADDDVLWWV